MQENISKVAVIGALILNETGRAVVPLGGRPWTGYA